MKQIKIFKLVLCFVLFAIITVTSPSLASSVKEDIPGHTYSVMINDMLYNISFVQGPFGPGVAGKATLMQDYTILNTYDFMCDGDIVKIDGLGNFFYGNYQIVYVPGDTVLLLKCDNCTTNESYQK